MMGIMGVMNNLLIALVSVTLTAGAVSCMVFLFVRIFRPGYIRSVYFMMKAALVFYLLPAVLLSAVIIADQLKVTAYPIYSGDVTVSYQFRYWRISQLNGGDCFQARAGASQEP